MSETGKISTKYLVLMIIFPIVIGLDQYTKHLVHSKFYLGESLPIIADFLSLTYVGNKGAAFGMLNKAPGWFRDPFFVIVPLVAMSVILVLFKKLDPKQSWSATALSLILSGAIGNLIDRLRLSYVVDFLDFHWKDIYHYPAFNVADSCIVIGVGMMLVQSFFPAKFGTLLSPPAKS